MTTRRQFMTGIAGMIAAGYGATVLPSGVIMPVKEIWTPNGSWGTCYILNDQGEYTVDHQFRIVDGVGRIGPFRLSPLRYEGGIRLVIPSDITFKLLTA